MEVSATLSKLHALQQGLQLSVLDVDINEVLLYTLILLHQAALHGFHHLTELFDFFAGFF